MEKYLIRRITIFSECIDVEIVFRVENMHDIQFGICFDVYCVQKIVKKKLLTSNKTYSIKFMEPQNSILIGMHFDVLKQKKNSMIKIF